MSNIKYEICYKQRLDDVVLYILNRFPEEIRTSILRFLEENRLSQINEIRLHRGSFIAFIADSKNIKSDIFIEQHTLSEIVTSLCGGSLYAHFDTIKEGYISLGNGIRAGICGRANVEMGNITGISDISSVNIRLPKRIFHSADYLFNLLKQSGFDKSIILYSSPGVGKTTILRELIYLISAMDAPIRNAVIDTREEITPFMSSCRISSDIFISYPKGMAIEIATKSMTPELIICDEISSMEEANAVLKATNCGVKIIATCHASSFEELCSKEILKGLFEHKVFDLALGIKREVGSKRYEFSLDSLCEE